MLVYAAVPPQSRLKLGGERGVLSVKPNGPPVTPVPQALLIVSEPGKMTAAAESERSWFPPEPSRSTSRVWYGDPGMVTAELVVPQSNRVEMCPPHASTGFATLVVKVIEILADLSPVKP